MVLKMCSAAKFDPEKGTVGKKVRNRWYRFLHTNNT